MRSGQHGAVFLPLAQDAPLAACRARHGECARKVHLAARVKGVKQQGRRTGNWLTTEQAQRLLDAPDTSTLRGLRDRALLATLLGCGLRRSELVDLTFQHIQQRSGRWAIIDLYGKHNRRRSIPMPAWCKKAIDAWASRADICEGRLECPCVRGAR